MTTLIDDVKSRMQRSVLLRMMFLGILVLSMQIPIAEIESTISERMMTKESAIQEVTGTWGQQQTLAGPVIAVPTIERWRDEKNNPRVTTRYAYFLPEKINVKGDVKAERRYRGIFAVPLYQSTLTLNGEFKEPELTGEVQWDQAELVLGLSDPKAIRDEVELTWDGRKLPFEPGRGHVDFLPSGIHLPLADIKSPHQPAVHKFHCKVVIGGSGFLRFLPFGTDSQVELSSTWTDPSFDGAYLPESRQVSTNGFEARWRVLHLGRGYPQKWLAGEVSAETLNASAFGVSFISPVDAYTATTRSVKYELLFVMLTFMVFFLFEVFHRVRIHPVQYLLVGFALCLFYLLLLALAEHIGFAPAYLAASIAVVAVTSGYCLSILKKAKMALIVATELAVLYGFLFVLLQVQDYALLVGSLGLFAVLAAIMFVTRKIDWYRLGAPAPEPGPTTLAGAATGS